VVSRRETLKNVLCVLKKSEKKSDNKRGICVFLFRNNESFIGYLCDICGIPDTSCD
jgi:hypothetical protein